MFCGRVRTIATEPCYGENENEVDRYANDGSNMVKVTFELLDRDILCSNKNEASKISDSNTDFISLPFAQSFQDMVEIHNAEIESIIY